MNAKQIIDRYISFFKDRGHVQIANTSLVPENDPTTLFTSSGMQPLVPYLLGELHPQGKRLVNVQNSFRAQDIEEVGDNRHTTFFRMLGNWSLGEYFKKEQIPWFWKFLTDKDQGLGLDPKRLYVTVFQGNDDVIKDSESAQIWTEIFEKEGLDPKERIFYYGVEKNWWSRAGVPANMPVGEPGGPDSEVFFDLETTHDPKFGKECHVNCDCGRYIEIGNIVFMQYRKTESGFEQLPQQNVDFGGGLERLIMVSEGEDVFQTSLFEPIISSIEKTTEKEYKNYSKEMRIITDHLTASVMIASNGVYPSNKERGYILRRLIRRTLDNFYKLGGEDVIPIIDAIVNQYIDTDPDLGEKYEHVKGVILEEQQNYSRTLKAAKEYLNKKYVGVEPLDLRAGGQPQGDELKGITKITAEDAFKVYTSQGLSPSQIKSLGYVFDDKQFSELMKEHQKVSRAGSEKKFKGGLADTSAQTIHGHTATHLLHKALRDKFGEELHQAGSNITAERVRFDFNFDRKLTPEEIKEIEDIVNQKINEDLMVTFKVLPLEEAKKLSAIGLFGEKYGDSVKLYFIGDENKTNQGSPSSGNQGESLSSSGRSNASFQGAYSIEFCGGPHVSNTSEIGSFKIIKEEGLGRGLRRIYSVVE